MKDTSFMHTLLTQSEDLDPVLKELEDQLHKKINAKVRIENLGQTLEYLIDNNKITKYA